MIPKAIIYSEHAALQRVVRGFTRKDVRDLLATGDRSHAKTHPGGSQRWEAKGGVRGRGASVIYIETAYEYFIITVQWTEAWEDN